MICCVGGGVLGKPAQRARRVCRLKAGSIFTPTVIVGDSRLWRGHQNKNQSNSKYFHHVFTLCWTLCLALSTYIFLYSFQRSSETHWDIIIPILKIRRLRLEEVTSLVQCHVAGAPGGQNLSLDILSQDLNL